jgi:Fe-S cluster assembly iron-binding protein IscA
VLTLTQNASTQIRTLINQPELPHGCGMRIANDPVTNNLTLSLAATPVDGDAVVDDAGARVFLDAEAAALLDDKALDATSDPNGQLQFTIQEPS